MTDDRVNLQALLEKSSDSELLREMIGFAAQRLMELEIDETVQTFLERPLAGQWPYLWLDATYIQSAPGRPGGLARRHADRGRQAAGPT